MKKNTLRTVLISSAGLIVIVCLILGGVWVNLKNTGNRDAATDTSHQEDTSSQSISKEKAEQIAIDKFGGTVKETEADGYHDSPAWEVELRDSKHGRIEVKVDKATGKILHYEKD